MESIVGECDPQEVLYERRCARYIYVVPDGLRELMNDISREVLRCQPSLNTYTFIADYLDSLMITRENARVANRFVENITETCEIVADIITRLNVTKEQADRAARIIQRAFRRHLKKMDSSESLDQDYIVERILRKIQVTRDKADQAVKIIQRAYRHHLFKRRAETDIAQIDWRILARNTIGMYRSANVTSAQLAEAATKIKAAYKGYYTRKIIKQLKFKTMVDNQLLYEIDLGSEEQDGDSSDDDQEQSAAIIIQRAFRRFVAKRKAQYEMYIKREHTLPSGLVTIYLEKNLTETEMKYEADSEIKFTYMEDAFFEQEDEEKHFRGYGEEAIYEN